MLKKINICLFILSISLSFLECKESKKEEVIVTKPKTSPTPTTLKNNFKEDFLIGAAISNSQIRGLDTSSRSLIKNEFNTITPENDMKWEQIHPKKDTFFFDIADKFVSLGQENDMHIVGHTLLWHSQLAPWVNEISNKDKLTTVIENHIQTIVNRYKGKIGTWDVINEALNEDGTPRKTHFYKVFKDESYIEKAFESAFKADPNAQLIYNDYNLWKPKKREGVVRIVKNLQAKGIKIDGVGIQAHWSIEGPAIEDIENSIIAYSKLGVKVMITELDVTVLKNPWELDGAALEQSYERYEDDPKMNPYADGLTQEVKEKISKCYKEFFNLFLKHRDKISRITFWGVNDGQSWLNNWPIKGRTNYPLLFDRNNKPKEIYFDIIALKK